MSSFVHYLLAQANTRAARERYNYATQHLENAQIKERLAEITSQHEPLNELMGRKDLSERQKLVASAYYVVFGGIPSTEALS